MHTSFRALHAPPASLRGLVVVGGVKDGSPPPISHPLLPSISVRSIGWLTELSWVTSLSWRLSSHPAGGVKSAATDSALRSAAKKALLLCVDEHTEEKFSRKAFSLAAGSQL
eukprot:2424948-Rhodomonas_salina.1